MISKMANQIKIDEVNPYSVFRDYNWDGWTEWVQLKELSSKSIPDSPGAYVLSAARPIQRAIGTDALGIIDIGECGKGDANLRVRLAKMQNCLGVRGNKGHMAGWRFAFFRFERHFPMEDLRVRWTTAGSKKEAYEREGAVMLTYLLRHCELPPLNYQFNWSAFEKLGYPAFNKWIFSDDCR
jgi:hypothetical protein